MIHQKMIRLRWIVHVRRRMIKSFKSLTRFYAIAFCLKFAPGCTVYESEGKKYLDKNGAEVLANSNGLAQWAVPLEQSLLTCESIANRVLFKINGTTPPNTQISNKASEEDTTDRHPCDLFLEEARCYFLETTDTLHSYVCSIQNFESDSFLFELFPESKFTY